jgi:acetyl-CoA carboxylase carboxyl transferase subunit alpha
VQVARHPDRPHCLDYVRALFTEFTPLAGDRAFGEDNAYRGGFARFRGESVAVLGQEKGNDTQSRLKHNFGMRGPEGYRKAVRVMEMADRFGIPVISLVDTAGAYPGIGAEERGQAEAIARSTSACLSLRTQHFADHRRGRVRRRDRDRRRQPGLHARAFDLFGDLAGRRGIHPVARYGRASKDAATNMKITAQDLLELKIIDGIIAEPLGGAHRAPEAIIEAAGAQIAKGFEELRQGNMDYREQRREKFLAMGRTL